MNDYLLHIKVLQNDDNALKNLIKSGVDLNILDPLGNSPLHLAVLCRNILLVKTLLFAGANPNILSNELLTPAAKAITIGYYDIAELLYSYSKYCILPSTYNAEGMHVN